MGVIEAKLIAEKPNEKPVAKPEVKITAAKKPISPVSSGKGITGSKSPDDMSLEEYRKWRESQS